MSSNIMIELRQSDAVNVSRNGEYECILSRDITISEGDVIQMSKAFVDSVKEGDIIIGDDLTLTIQSGVYLLIGNNYLVILSIMRVKQFHALVLLLKHHHHHLKDLFLI